MPLRNKVFGYVFDKDGLYEKRYVFEDTPENIANFIMRNMFYKCTITDPLDNLILTSTVGGFVDYCKDKEYLMKVLLTDLLPLQLGDKETKELKFRDLGHHYEQVL